MLQKTNTHDALDQHSDTIHFKLQNGSESTLTSSTVVKRATNQILSVKNYYHIFSTANDFVCNIQPYPQTSAIPTKLNFVSMHCNYY